MATSIPFDPALVLGNLIHPEDIKKLEDIATAQKPVDVAQNKLNQSIATKRKLDMTLQEMVEMNVPVDSLSQFKKQIIEVEEQIADNASEYGDAVV